MAEKKHPVSEAEELDSFLAALESRGEVKEIAGWETGFASLSRALNGISPGLYLLIGPPACGKSAFAKQLLDQIDRTRCSLYSSPSRRRKAVCRAINPFQA